MLHYKHEIKRWETSALFLLTAANRSLALRKKNVLIATGCLKVLLRNHSVNNSLDFAAYFRENFCSSMRDFSFSVYINHSICAYFVPSVVAFPGSLT